jgi:hypothetical protein
MLTDELLKTIQADRERQIAQARLERLATTKPEPEPWTWLRHGPAARRRILPVRGHQASRAAADSSL